jgi:hypothetical protein
VAVDDNRLGQIGRGVGVQALDLFGTDLPRGAVRRDELDLARSKPGLAKGDDPAQPGELVAGDRFPALGGVDLRAIRDRGRIGPRRNRGIEGIDTIAGDGERLLRLSCDQSRAQQRGVDLPVLEGIVHAGEAASEDWALADLHGRADQGGEQERVEQLEQGSGTEGEAGVYFQTEVPQAFVRTTDDLHTVRVARHPPGGQPHRATVTQIPKSGRETLNSSNFLILEYAISPTRDACQVGEVFKATDGRIELPTRPGLGVDLDEEYLLKNAHDPGKAWQPLLGAEYY